MTPQEMLQVTVGSVLYHRVLRNADGSPMRVKVNGRAQAAKRDIHKMRVPYKHGLWDYGYISYDMCVEFARTEEEALEG